ncbi:MAG: phosphatidylserine decarboxylase, partial [Planctomycetota bacterium]
LEVELAVCEAWSQEGDLQPVDPSLAGPSRRILVRNRRILLHCRSEEGTPFAILLVGAFNVGRILFSFDPTLGGKRIQNGLRHYAPPCRLAAGEEMGRFELGSSVVLFAPPDRRPLLPPGEPCRAREPLLAAPAQETEN